MTSPARRAVGSADRPSRALSTLHRVLGRRNERGAEAVEFALIMPILLLLVFGIIQYGFYFWAMQGGAAAAREAARMSAVGRPAECDDFEDEVSSKISAVSHGSEVIKRSFVDRDASSTLTVGDDVVISLTFNSFDLNMPLIPFVDNGTVAETAQARVEYLPTPTMFECP